MIDFAKATLAPLDFGAAGGLLLLLDMVLFAVLAANWELAGRVRLRPAKNTPPKR